MSDPAHEHRPTTAPQGAASRAAFVTAPPPRSRRSARPSTPSATVYQSYGFEPLETPAFEFTDALGKFLPDVDRPNEGVFSLRDDDEQWMSLRYDLTAPLARYVAENFQNLPKPFRRYQVGQVWRNEKPGPGRYREFTQFDADTVGSNSPAADAELLMMVCDALEAAGTEARRLRREDQQPQAARRPCLTSAQVSTPAKRGTVLRAIDKLDRLGADGVRAAARRRAARTSPATSPRARS